MSSDIVTDLVYVRGVSKDREDVSGFVRLLPNDTIGHPAAAFPASNVQSHPNRLVIAKSSSIPRDYIRERMTVSSVIMNVERGRTNLVDDDP